MEINDSLAVILKHKGQASIHAVAPGDTVFDAIKLMADRNIGCVLVLEGGVLRGILSERDYTRKVMLLAQPAVT